MKLAIVTNDELKKEFLSKPISAHASLAFFTDLQHIPADADAVFDLLFEPTSQRISQLQQFLPKPVFINAVIETIASIKNPFIRINAWPTFLERPVTEMAALPEQILVAKEVFEKIEWNYLPVPDITGMISPRIAAAIIYEAYFTLNEKTSTMEEIDIAMKLGTNYPLGPFEWSRKIGLSRICELFNQLSKENNLYEVQTLINR